MNINWLYAKKLLIDLWESFLFLFTTNGWVGKLILAIAAFYAPVQLYAVSIFGLVVLDVFTGIWAAYKQGEPFKSRKLRQGLIEKVVLYGMLFTGTIIMGKVLQSVLHYQTFYIAWFFTLLVLVYELSSIIENVIKINPELAFLKKITGLLKRIEKNELQKVENEIRRVSVHTDELQKVKNEIKRVSLHTDEAENKSDKKD